MPFPRLGRFGSHPSHPRRLVRFASMHVPTEVRSAAVRMPCGRLCLLPRLSVSIVFKMFSCQSFKTLRLFGMALLYGYRGRFQSRRFVVPSSVPPRRGRADCLRPLRRRPSRPSCRYPSPASRFPPRPSNTIGGAEALVVIHCLLGGTENGACCLVGAVMRSCRCLPHACLRSPAVVPLTSSTPLARSVPAWRRRSPVFIMLAIHYRPAHRHGRRGAGRGGRLFCGDAH